jgi:hypothetical protein
VLEFYLLTQQNDTGEVTQAEFDTLENRVDGNELLSIRNNYKYVRPKGHTKNITGYNILSLPNNVGNGQLSVTVKGNTYKNIIVNGNFAGGTTGWTGQNSTNTASNGVLSNTGNGANAYPQTYQSTNTAIVTGKKIFVRAKARVRATSNSLTLQIAGSGGGSVLSSPALNNPTVDAWYSISYIFTLTDQIGNVRLNIVHTYPDATTANGKVMEVQEVMAIDLTALGLDALTVDQCNQRFPSWFDGTKSTLSTRLKSVGKNLFDGVLEVGTIGSVGQNIVDTTRIRTKNFIKVSSLTQYKLSDDKGSILARVCTYDVNKIFISEIGTTIFTTPSNCAYLRWSYTSNSDINTKSQLELGSTATTYEPYTETSAYLPEVGRSLPNGTKDEVSVDANGQWQKVQRVSNNLDLSILTWTKSANGTTGFAYYTPMPANGTFNGVIYKNGVILTQVSNDTAAGNSNIDTWWFNTSLNRIYLNIPTDSSATEITTGKYTLNYQLMSNIVTSADVVGDLVAYPNGTVIATPCLYGFINGVNKKVITTSAVPISAINKVLRYDISSTGKLVKTDITADCTITDSNTSITIANADLNKTYFYDCDIPTELSTSAEIVLDVEVDNGIISHDYAASAVDWVLTTNESKATMLTTTNAGGAAKIIALPIDGKMYVIKNTSGQTITIKTASSTGVTIATTKTATVIYTGTDYIKISEV